MANSIRLELLLCHIYISQFTTFTDVFQAMTSGLQALPPISLVHVSLVTSLQCEVESVECGIWSVKYEVRSVERKV